MANIFIVSPTLEELLELCSNPKDASFCAEMDYSNFKKTCKLQHNLTLSTYSKCAESLGYATIIYHIPKEVLLPIKDKESEPSLFYQIISEKEFIDKLKLKKISSIIDLLKDVEKFTRVLNKFWKKVKGEV